jgi:hypothetical protein
VQNVFDIHCIFFTLNYVVDVSKYSPLDSGVGSHSRILSGGADVLDGRESAMQNNLNMLDCEIGKGVAMT